MRVNADASEQIQLNAIHRDIALNAATDLLKDSINRLNMQLDLPTSDLIIACHALLTQREYDENHQLAFLRSFSDSLEGISCKMDKLIESVDCAGAILPMGDLSLTALSTEHALAALKACWLTLHPQHTEQEYRAAIFEFEKLLGL